MNTKNSAYSIVTVLLILGTQGLAGAQDIKPKSFKVKALSGQHKNQEVSLEKLLPSSDFKELTLLMFVTKSERRTGDENVVKLARFVDYIVKTYAGKSKTRGAVIFLDKSYPKAREELAGAKLAIPVAVYLTGDLDGYMISKKDPVTVVMWSDSRIEKRNIKVWSSEDFENFDKAGQGMVVQFIRLLN